MKIRPLILVILFVGVFIYVTSYGGFRDLPEKPLAGLWRQSPMHLIEADAQPTYTPEEANRIAVYKRALPTVVNVTSSALKFDFFYGVVPQEGQGSGFVLTRDGRILTNFHVVQSAQNVEVTTSDKRKYKARVILQDRAHDLALLQINAKDLAPAILSQSSDLQVGQNVYAIGNPFGLSGTMTTGIISAIRPVQEPEGPTIDKALQTDAAINPGNSGGPLLNSRGEVIGMNTLIATGGAEQNSGIGFAIPVDTIKAVLSDYAKYGRVRRPSLGIVSLAIGPDLAEQMGLPADYGVLVQKVVPGGSAERAGLRGGNQEEHIGNTPIFLGGDFIVGIDNDRVTSPQDISEIMDRHQAGDTVVVTFFRGSRRMTAKLTLGEAHSISA
jgi:S1-C subfamily serine protease